MKSPSLRALRKGVRSRSQKSEGTPSNARFNTGMVSDYGRTRSSKRHLSEDKYMIYIVHDLQKSVESMKQDIEVMKNDIHDLLRKLDDKEWYGYGEPVELVEMPVDEIKKLILTTMDKSKPFYPSDVADNYNLNYDAVREAVEELLSEGHLKE